MYSDEEIYRAAKITKWALQAKPDVLERALTGGGVSSTITKDDVKGQMVQDIIKSIHGPEHKKQGEQIAKQVEEDTRNKTFDEAAAEIIKAVS